MTKILIYKGQHDHNIDQQRLNVWVWGKFGGKCFKHGTQYIA